MTRKAPSVRLAAGDDASGMANMLGELLADNLADYPARARVARVVRGPVVMTAADRDRSVTVRFSGDEVLIDEGVVPGAACITGEWLDLAKLCSGQLSPFRAVFERRLDVDHLRRADLLAAAGFVMSVPASYYGDAPRVARWRILLVALAVVALAVLVATLVRRAR